MARAIRTVDTDFDYKEKEYWYKAEVVIDYSTTPETCDSPAEESWDCDVTLLEVEEYLGSYKSMEIELNELDEELKEAIIEDAEKQALDQLGEVE